jgi:hypothetical protein
MNMSSATGKENNEEAYTHGVGVDGTVQYLSHYITTQTWQWL